MPRFTIIRCDSCNKEQTVGEPDSPSTIFTLLQIIDAMGTNYYFCDKACALNWLTSYESPYTKNETLPPDAMPGGMN